MKPIVLLLANTLSLLATLIVNYTAGTGVLHSQSIGEVSDQYPTLVTPADYAFSIWGFIYLLLIAFVAYQWVGWFKGRKEESLNKAGGWFFLANLFNALWVVAFVHEAFGLSVLLMFLLLFSLVRLLVRLEMEIWDAPLRIIAFVWWPICVYTGWIVLATVTNVAVYLKTFDLLSELLSAELWAVLVLILAGLIYLFLVWSRNMREAALVGIWGLVAIAYRQWGSNDSVVTTALLLAGILFLYVGYHGFRNKETSPFMKWKRGEF